MNRMTAVAFSLAALLALPACATRGNQAEELTARQIEAAKVVAEPGTFGSAAPAVQGAERPDEHSGAEYFWRAMGGALFGAGVGYVVVYSLGGPALVSMAGTPVVTVGAVTGAVAGLAKASSHR